MTTEVVESFINPWHPDAISPIDPRDPHIVHPTVEFGPESYVDTGYASHAKYPKSKRKTTRKQDKDTKKKKLDFKGMTQTTLDRWLFKPRTPTQVWFKERVLF